jgi:lipopolysaccharide transport system permease protein
MPAAITQSEPLPAARFGLFRALFGPATVCWQHRSLIARLFRRDIDARYRGSVLGLGWAVLTPLLMLGVYTLVFAVVLESRWPNQPGTAAFAARVYLGLILIQILARTMGETPLLLRQNRNLVKKVVFPLEVLVPVRVASAVFDALAGYLVFLAIGWAMSGIPPWTIVLVPLAAVPVALLSLAFGWTLAGLGAYLPDLAPIAGTLATVILFTSAVFYPADIVPHPWRWLIDLNPIAASIETARGLAFHPAAFDAARFGVLLLASWIAAGIGLLVFRRVRGGFPDVL